MAAVIGSRVESPLVSPQADANAPDSDDLGPTFGEFRCPAGFRESVEFRRGCRDVSPPFLPRSSDVKTCDDGETDQNENREDKAAFGLEDS